MQQGKQPFWARLKLLARLTLNAGKRAGNQPARLAHLDDGYDRAILVQGDEGPAQSLPRRRPGSFGWGIAGTPSIRCSDEVAIPRRPPHSIYRSLSQRCGFILVEEKGPQIDQACLERRRQPVIRPAV